MLTSIYGRAICMSEHDFGRARWGKSKGKCSDIIWKPCNFVHVLNRFDRYSQLKVYINRALYDACAALNHVYMFCVE